MENAVELRITAEARFDSHLLHASILTLLVELEKARDSLPVAEVNQRHSNLRPKHTTELRGTETTALGYLIHTELRLLRDDHDSFVDRRMYGHP